MKKRKSLRTGAPRFLYLPPTPSRTCHLYANIPHHTPCWDPPRTAGEIGSESRARSMDPPRDLCGIGGAGRTICVGYSHHVLAPPASASPRQPGTSHISTDEEQRGVDTIGTTGGFTRGFQRLICRGQEQGPSWSAEGASDGRSNNQFSSAY